MPARARRSTAIHRTHRDAVALLEALARGARETVDLAKRAGLAADSPMVKDMDSFAQGVEYALKAVQR